MKRKLIQCGIVFMILLCIIPSAIAQTYKPSAATVVERTTLDSLNVDQFVKLVSGYIHADSSWTRIAVVDSIIKVEIIVQTKVETDTLGANNDPQITIPSNMTFSSGTTLDVSAGTLALAADQISGDKVEGGTINAITINTLTVGSGKLIELPTGKVGIGTATPDRRLHAEEDNAATAIAVPIIRASVTSTGTPAAGLGPSVEFEVETAAGAPGNQEVIAAIDGIATDVTGASEDGAIVFKTMKAGATATEDARVSGGDLTVTGNIGATTYGSDGSISDAELLTLDNGATTEILVGGGAGSAPVWTTATGTGAPVRASSPALLGSPTIETSLLPDANAGANIGAAATAFQYAWIDTVYAEHYGGQSPMSLGGKDEPVTVLGDFQVNGKVSVLSPEGKKVQIDLYQLALALEEQTGRNIVSEERKSLFERIKNIF